MTISFIDIRFWEDPLVRAVPKSLDEQMERREKEVESTELFFMSDLKTTKLLYMNNLNGTKNQLKQANIKLFEREAFVFHGKRLEGFAQILGLASYLKDLQNFKDALPVNYRNLGRIEKIKQAVEFAFEIAIDQNDVNCDKDLIGSLIKEKMREKIYEQLKKLNAGGVGEVMILPGGVSSTKAAGHSIIYEICKESEEKFSFTIVNTGLGARNAPSSFYNILNHQIVDTEYTDVPREILEDQDFLQLLTSGKKAVEVGDDDRVSAAMAELNKEIADYFKSKGISPTDGNKHRAQEQGSCAFKSVSASLHNVLGEEYQKFKVFVTHQEIDRLKSLENNDSLEGKQKLIAKTLREKTEDVLEYRTKKLQNPQAKPGLFDSTINMRTIHFVPKKKKIEILVNVVKLIGAASLFAFALYPATGDTD